MLYRYIYIYMVVLRKSPWHMCLFGCAFFFSGNDADHTAQAKKLHWTVCFVL